MRTNRWLAASAALLVVGLGVAEAQRGRGEEEGLARQGVQPEMVEIKGTLTSIETGPCSRTTGQAYIGTHLMIHADDGRDINLHIGAADAVKDFVDTLQTGQAIEAVAFRTDLLEANHYVAKTLRSGETTLEVRRDDLSPFWAQQRRDRDRRDRGAWGTGDGPRRDRRQDRRSDKRVE